MVNVVRATNVYALLLQLSGMSQAEAAAFHNVRPDTVVSWSSGRRGYPAGAVDEIRALIRTQERKASERVAEARRDSEDEIVLTHPDDPASPLMKGFKSIGAWRGYAARVAASAPMPTICIEVPGMQATEPQHDPDGDIDLDEAPKIGMS